jgi:hypothetical protein
MKRIILLFVLALEGLGGISGGGLLVAAPDGRYMKMPVEIMHGAFPDFFIPGLILTGMGILTSAAFIAVLLRSKIDWLLAGLALVGFAIWFSVEILVLRELHWLHIVWGTPVLIGIWAALPLIPEERKIKLSSI